MLKTLVIVMLLAIIASLVSGLGFMLSGRSRNTARALTLRIGLSITLFALLLMAYAAGLITPHGILPYSQ
ncbi:MAG: twin transmembrane helix small protein [Pseudomonadota bacterium]|nr:twin transmembrane helix small protein [Pseudomonadota bacterium]